MIVRALGGEPATGKSTVMVEAMKLKAYWARFKDGLVVGHVNERERMVVLGTYSEGESFPGTDRLSMAVQPAALKYLSGLARAGGWIVLFEGDRLFNLSFLLALVELGQVEATVLVASNLSLESRHAARGDSQRDGFLKGRRTKIARILAGFPCHVEINERPCDTARIAASLVR